MGARDLGSLADVLEEARPSGNTLLLLNVSEPEATPLGSLLERAFEDQSVSVARRHVPEGPTNLVCLVADGEVVATTPWAELKRAFLLVNADRYRTGNRQIETGSFPDVLTGLDETVFTVRGFPASNKEKLLLVVVSRFVEFRALSRGAGELATSFQFLSRLDDEFGTRRVYEWLGASDVETHVYGVPDDPAAVADLDVTVHGGDFPELRRSWVVVFAPPAGQDGHAALLAEEVGPNVWRGLWTYDPDRVNRILAYVRETF